MNVVLEPGVIIYNFVPPNQWSRTYNYQHKGYVDGMHVELPSAICGCRTGKSNQIVCCLAPNHDGKHGGSTLRTKHSRGYRHAMPSPHIGRWTYWRDWQQLVLFPDRPDCNPFVHKTRWVPRETIERAIRLSSEKLNA